MKVLITGASGFIGRSLSKQLSNDGFHVVKAYRNISSKLVDGVVVGEINKYTDWNNCLNVDVIVHLAALAHIKGKNASTIEESFIEVNVRATVNLASQAIEKGIKRFIYISSIGVNGTSSKQPFTENDTPNPTTPYAQSKYEAERALIELCESADMELVIIRPPLVYGAGAKGSFASLSKLIQKIPLLPFRSTRNKKDFISINNLTDFISYCVSQPKAANETFLISDRYTVSLGQFLKEMSVGLDKKIILIPFPVSIFKCLLKALGASSLFQQLFGNLEIDSSKANNLLGWNPVETMPEAMKELKG